MPSKDETEKHGIAKVIRRLRRQVEVLTLSGNFTEQDGEPRLHAHVAVGKRDGSAHGGHLLRGMVFPTLEAIVVEVAAELRRKIDPETGLPGSEVALRVDQALLQDATGTMAASQYRMRVHEKAPRRSEVARSE